LSSSLEYYFYLLAGFYIRFYIVAIILTLLASIFFKSEYRKESFNLLYTFNTLVAWCSFILLFLLAEVIFITWYGQNLYEWYVFKTDVQISWQLFYVVMIAGYLFGILFFFRRLRINRVITLLFVLVLSFWSIRKLLFSLYSDYLPSSWPTYYTESILHSIFKYVVVILLITAIYFRAKKRGRLPYPSIFVK
jgi:molybdopterin-containing oxidoreductase family membrane subunit